MYLFISLTDIISLTDNCHYQSNGRYAIIPTTKNGTILNTTRMINMSEKYTLLPLFDTLDNIANTIEPNWNNTPSFCKTDYKNAVEFLISYNGSHATFNAYRRELERLLHWSWKVAEKSICDLRRADIESYLQFCQKPPENWIGLKKVPRFVVENALRVPNPEWRPFVVTISKSANKSGEKLEVKNYCLSETALKEIFAITSSFYNFLIQIEATEINPVAHIRQKSKFIRKHQSKPKIRRLSELQWEYVIETAEMLAKENADKYERTLFILSSLYLMYLRISELAASSRWTPHMNDFRKDNDGNWWFTVVGKGNKES